MRGRQPRINARQRAPIWLVRTAWRGIATGLGKCKNRLGRIAHQRRDRNLRAKTVDALKIMPDSRAAVTRDRILQRFGIHKRVAVAIATYPTAELNKPGRPAAKRLLPARI